MPLPAMDPGALSAMYVYNGRPAYASCSVPSLRVMLVNGAGYAVFAVPGTLGQTAAHCPLHADAPGVARSASNTYTVRDWALTKPSAPAKVAVPSGAAAGAVVGAAVGVGVETGAVLGFGVGAETLFVGGSADGELPPPPHAVSSETASVAASGKSCR